MKYSHRAMITDRPHGNGKIGLLSDIMHKIPNGSKAYTSQTTSSRDLILVLSQSPSGHGRGRILTCLTG